MALPQIPERFNQPDGHAMAELKLYVDRYEDEVQRVRNVCVYWERNIMRNRPFKAPVLLFKVRIK